MKRIPGSLPSIVFLFIVLHTSFGGIFSIASTTSQTTQTGTIAQMKLAGNTTNFDPSAFSSEIADDLDINATSIVVFNISSDSIILFMILDSPTVDSFTMIHELVISVNNSVISSVLGISIRYVLLVSSTTPTTAPPIISSPYSSSKAVMGSSSAAPSQAWLAAAVIIPVVVVIVIIVSIILLTRKKKVYYDY